MELKQDFDTQESQLHIKCSHLWVSPCYLLAPELPACSLPAYEIKKIAFGEMQLISTKLRHFSCSGGGGGLM